MTRLSFNREISEQAADWAVRLDSGALSKAEQKALADWLRTSPLHIDEFLLASTTLGGFGFVDPDKQIDVDALLKAASAEVIPMEPLAPTTDRPVRGWHRMAATALLSLVAVATTASLVWWTQPAEISQPAGQWYETGLGEQRSIQLADSSVVHINTQSRLKVDYTEAERRIELVFGEAMFEVEPNAERPFRVWAGGTVAEALGTTFNVRVEDEVAIVSVVEGTVKVDKRALETASAQQSLPKPAPPTEVHASAPRTEVILSIGEIASVPSSDDVVNIDQDTIEAITSWRERKLVFEGDRLDVIAAEFNRYNRTQLVVSDTDLASVKFTGVFDADDPDSFVEFLEFAGGVQAVHEGQEIQLGQPNAN